MKPRLLALALLAALAGGCAVPSLTLTQAEHRANDRVADLTQSIASRARTPAAVRELNEPYLEFKRVAATARRGDVNVKAASSPFGALLSEITRQAGYSLVLADSVDASRKVTVDFRNAQTEDAMRTTAFLAGYAAVIDRERRTVTVAETATYTFKLPAGVFSQLQAVYAAGGNATSASGGSSNSGGAGGSSGVSGGMPGSGAGGGTSGGAGGASVQASFTISGRESIPNQSIQRLITDIAGTNAQVTVSEMGFISVRANGQALRRVNDFLKRVSIDAMTQVDIEAAVVEVSLANEFAYGIDWTRVLARAASTYQVATSAAGAIADGLSITRTSANTTTIVQALNRFTNTQVVSQPRLFTMNNTPANFIQGTQVPYLGSIEQTQGGALGGAPTTSGSVAFAIDGISFGVVPSVIDGKHVQISLMPVISTLGEAERFALGDSAMLTAYRQANKQTFMRVMAESGQTLVLGGIRQGSQMSDTSLARTTTSRNNATEVVILLRATVVPAPDYDPLAGESV
jgi:hypothetical protein